MLFTRDLGERLTGLVKKIDDYAKAHEGLKAWMVVVADQQENEAKVKELAQQKELKLPIVFFAEGPTSDTATKLLKLNPEVKYTIVAYKDKKVTANFALNEITDETAPKVTEAAEAIAPK